jgi:DNA-directed RNA polymerase subunit RPC12/RpoP
MVDRIEEKVGTKIRCGYCNGKILIQAPPSKRAAAPVKPAPLKLAPAKQTPVTQAQAKQAVPVKKRKQPESEIIELDQDAIVVDEDEFEIPDLEYGVDDVAEAELVQAPVQNHRLLAAGRPKKKKSESFQESADGKERPAKQTKVTSSAIFIWVAAGAVTLCTVCSVLVLGFAATGAGGGGGGKFQEPEEYVDFSPANLQLSCSVPKGWEQKYGGGSGGVPIFATFTSGKISIDIRESHSGGAMGAAQLALQQRAGSDPAEAVESIHDAQQAGIAETFDAYKEDAEARTVKTLGFGPGKVSDFDADGGFLGGGHVRGCRATVMNQLHQFNVVCKCPAPMFEQVQPVFEKVIGSLGG